MMRQTCVFIVGGGSVVSVTFPDHVVIGRNLARVIR